MADATTWYLPAALRVLGPHSLLDSFKLIFELDRRGGMQWMGAGQEGTC